MNINISVYTYIKTYGSLKYTYTYFLSDFWSCSFYYNALSCIIIGADLIINYFLKVRAVLSGEIWISCDKLNSLGNFVLRSYVSLRSTSRPTYHLIPITHELLNWVIRLRNIFSPNKKQHGITKLSNSVLR
jgi:hypothetical protein